MGQTRGKNSKITTCTFDAISVSVLECFGRAIIVCFYIACITGAFGCVSISEV